MRFRTSDIMPPPIAELQEAAKKHIGASSFLNLGQGLPGHIPPRPCLDILTERIMHPSAHRYTPDPGLVELREELAIYLRQNSGLQVDPSTELVVTTGANSAFAGTILTIMLTGQNIVIPSPHYFNSLMAVNLFGGHVKEVPVNGSFKPEVENIEAAIDDRTCAVLLITPNNPTGAVYDRETIDAVTDICIDRNLWLITDETYARMAFDDSIHYSPRSRRDAGKHVITLGSFSKDFGMSGWRVGYVVGPPDFTKEFLKVQDTITICAPTAGQMLALEVLKSGLLKIDEEIQKLKLLRDLAYLRISEIEALETVRTAGTFYMFPRVKGCTDSRSLVLDILQTAEVLVLPGSVFGTSGEGFIRLSIGPLTPEAVDEAFDRLKAYFEG
ncbi:MAG: pyridoxal phosphate-dependent aminotransferase [Candidatus Thorarchaeota archaeon]|nr:MAG: pyridoxal phosphate-dependent aminotransferase [Candidatus Thorarchaeota archaeon]